MNGYVSRLVAATLLAIVFSSLFSSAANSAIDCDKFDRLAPVIDVAGQDAKLRDIQDKFDCLYDIILELKVAISTLQKTLEVTNNSIVLFNSTACPKGWSEFIAARGRYIVGVKEGEAVGDTIGKKLEEGQDRSVGRHDHSVGNSREHRHIARGGSHYHKHKDKYISKEPSGITTGSSYHRRDDTRKTDVNGAHEHRIDSSGSHSHMSSFAGSTEGTNAPYLQLLFCKKGT